MITNLISSTLGVLLTTLSAATLAEEQLQFPPQPIAPISTPPTLETVVISAPRLLQPTDSTLGASELGAPNFQARRAASSDTAELLQDMPGVSLYGAGGVSSLPAIHGLADDRLRTEVDGMDLVAACPNHMNSVLSYIDPSKVAAVRVYAGVTPVSVGGDSIGGTIQVTSEAPEFAGSDQAPYAKGHASTFSRSNGDANGYDVGATFVGHGLNVSFSQSDARANDYMAGEGFKASSQLQSATNALANNAVGSTAYHSGNMDFGIAFAGVDQRIQLNVGQQNIPFEGFPNQRMDMTSNQSTQVNLRYLGQFTWGDLEARAYSQDVQHRMDMGPDRFNYGTGMPMNTQATTNGISVQGNWVQENDDIVRIGVEVSSYRLNDWWPAVGGTMGPDTFWNVDFGQRDKVDTFIEHEAQLSSEWTSLLGVRTDMVHMESGPVQGYDDSLAGLWGNDVAAFNAQGRDHTDHNIDFTALLRNTPSELQSFDFCFARKTRSPNLYQMVAWSTQPMAALMNNFVGDGNGYVGNLALRPEVATTLSTSADWHDTESRTWTVNASAYYTYIQDYIDVQRCVTGQCAATNATATNSFVILQYLNQTAQIQGFDLSGHIALGRCDDCGSFSGSGILDYVRGVNLTTGDNLYNIMPLNTRLSVVQSLAGLTNTVEMQLVAAKSNVSQVHNEVPTPGYGLLNLRSSYTWHNARLDLGIENVQNRFYSMPLGGVYLGQGASMSSTGIPWGVAMPGMGRSINLALRVNF